MFVIDLFLNSVEMIALMFSFLAIGWTAEADRRKTRGSGLRSNKRRYTLWFSYIQKDAAHSPVTSFESAYYTLMRCILPFEN